MLWEDDGDDDGADDDDDDCGDDDGDDDDSADDDDCDDDDDDDCDDDCDVFLFYDNGDMTLHGKHRGCAVGAALVGLANYIKTLGTVAYMSPCPLLVTAGQQLHTSRSYSEF